MFGHYRRGLGSVLLGFAFSGGAACSSSPPAPAAPAADDGGGATTNGGIADAGLAVEAAGSSSDGAATSSGGSMSADGFSGASASSAGPDASPDAGVSPGDDATVPVADAGSPADAAADGQAVDGGVPAPASVLALMRLVADYQLAAGPGPTHADWVNKWTESVFYTGVVATYAATNDAKYRDAATTWANGNHWTLLAPTRSADDQSAGQVYLELSILGGGVAADIQSTKGAIDAMIAAPQPGRVDWWWADALFMAPPVIARLGAATGDSKYDAFLDTMWADATTYLFDPVHKLFWRDKTFFNTDTFWSRGNGWVVGGIARVLEYLPPADPSTATYQNLLRTLVASVAPLQGADGLWRSDLLHPDAFPNPETSGTSLFAFGMAWGINHGVLDRATYLPVTLKAWHGLTTEVNAQGRLGYVQATGSQPAAASATDSYDYGVGAFLLAASEVARLK